jgi:ribulose-phosphate 3-epimerase
MVQLSPSILAADFSALGAEIEKAERGGAHFVHVDVMDGHFVPNISFGAKVVQDMRGKTKLPFDVHLMIENADRYLPDFVTENTAFITVHQEACIHLDRTLAHIRSLGVRPGVALNPATPLSALDCVLAAAELVLRMTVNPGFGGQTFIPYTLEKVRRLAEIRRERGLSFAIQTDGGIGLDNAAALAAAGADIFVAGSALFGAADPVQWMRDFFARTASAGTQRLSSFD